MEKKNLYLYRISILQKNVKLLLYPTRPIVVKKKSHNHTYNY